MDEFERDGITEEHAKKEKKGPGKLLKLIGRLAALVVTIALVVGAVYLVVHRDEISIDSLRRHIAYRTGSSTVAQSITYTGNVNGSFASFQDGLLACSETQLQYYDRTGELIVDEKVELAQPVVDVQDSYALVYDAGGTELYLLHNDQLKRNYTPAKNQQLLSARVHKDGWLTIVEQATGYKASVTVYNAEFQPVVTENISSSFITDAILSQDKKTLALVSIGEADTGFESTIIFYNVSDGAERSRCNLGSDVVLELEWEKDGLWVMGEFGAYLLVDEAISASYTDTSRYLQGLSLGGDGFAALFYSKYQGGGTGSLTVFHTDSTNQSVSLNEEVLSVCACGDYLAVLTPSELTIYKSDLTVYAQVENTWSARRVLMRDDGSAMLVSTERASLYIPD